MSQRTRILLTYAIGVALLWVGVFWLRHVFPASKFTQLPPGTTSAKTTILPSAAPTPPRQHP